MNEIIANKKDINDEILGNYFKYQNPLFLAKYLIRAKQARNKELVNNVKDGLLDLRNVIIRKEIPENGNLNKIPNIIEIILDFNKQQKVNAGNTSENLLNEFHQIL